MKKSKSNAPSELEDGRGVLDVVMDKKVREYHVATETKYIVEDRRLIKCSSDMNITIDFLCFSKDHDIMDVHVTRQENNYGITDMQEEQLRLMDQVSDIQAHLTLAIDRYGRIKNVLNFDELHDKWRDIKTRINPNSDEMAKIIHDGDEVYGMGEARFAKRLNMATPYKALGMGQFSFEKATRNDDSFRWKMPSTLIPTIGIDLNIIRDDVVSDPFEPITLQVFRNRTAQFNAYKIEAKFRSLFPLLKKQMGNYRLQFSCSVNKDDQHGWPVSIEWAMSECVSPVLADVHCKVELV